MSTSRLKYEPRAMDVAIQQVKAGMSQKKAARLNGVPRTTLSDKVRGISPLHCKSGPGTILSTMEEQQLADHIKSMAAAGFPMTRKDLVLEVKRLLDEDGRVTKFHENLPGKDWYYGFLQRHPDLTMRKPSPLGHQRANVTQDDIRSWYRTFQSYLSDTNSLDALEPNRIFNCDESGFPLCVTTGKVLASKGCKNVYQRVSNTRQQITVLACMSGSGFYMPPYILYPGKRIRNVDVEGFKEAIFGTSESGWMTGEVFFDFLSQFDKQIEKENIQRPVILLVDGHASHVTLQAAQFCSEKQIILYSLHPHASHIQQPCDLSLFGPMKQVWKDQVHIWHMNNLGENFTKKDFPAVFKTTWEKSATADNAKKGFLKAGLCPFDPSVVDTSRIIASHEQIKETLSKQSQDDTSNAVSSDSLPHCSSTKAVHQPSQAATPALATIATPLSLRYATAAVQTSPTSSTFHSPQTVTAAIPSSISSMPQAATVPSSTSSLPTEIPPQTPLTSTPHTQPTVEPATSNAASGSTSAFKRLNLPTAQQKSKRQCLSAILPNAISGSEAIIIMQEREEAKQAAEREKEDRKKDRLRKKQEREEAARVRKVELAKRKAEAAKKKEDKKKLAEEKRKKKKRPRTLAISSESENDENLVYMDSDDEGEMDRDICSTCNGHDGSEQEWIGCDQCPRWYHLQCCEDENVLGLSMEELEKYVFICVSCTI